MSDGCPWHAVLHFGLGILECREKFLECGFKGFALRQSSQTGLLQVFFKIRCRGMRVAM